MRTETVADFTASDLKTAGPVLDAATRGVVRIKRRGQAFLLLREEDFDRIVAKEAAPRPKTLAERLENYDPAKIRKLLGGWTDFPPAGREI